MVVLTVLLLAVGGAGIFSCARGVWSCWLSIDLCLSGQTLDNLPLFRPPFELLLLDNGARSDVRCVSMKIVAKIRRVAGEWNS